MHSRHILLLIALVTALMGSACSDSDTPPAKTNETVPSSDHAKVAGSYTDQEASADVLAAGERLFGDTLYQVSCAGCHAVKAGEMRTTAPNLRDVFKVTSAREGGAVKAKEWLHNKILHSDKVKGVNSEGWATQMPIFAGQVKDSDIRQIVEWLASLK